MCYNSKQIYLFAAGLFPRSLVVALFVLMTLTICLYFNQMRSSYKIYPVTRCIIFKKHNGFVEQETVDGSDTRGYCCSQVVSHRFK